MIAFEIARTIPLNDVAKTQEFYMPYFTNFTFNFSYFRNKRTQVYIWNLILQEALA